MANEQTRGMSDFATTQDGDTGNDMKGRAREAVSQVKERAGERIESRISDTKTRAAETLSGVASSLLSSSESLRDQNNGASRAFERAAEGIDRFASYLQDTDVDVVVDQVHEFARRQPAAFIGGAFALGFIASRFLKASTPGGSRHLPAPSDYGRGYGSSYPTTRSYEGDIGRSGGYGNTGDISGSMGYGAGLSTGAGGTTGGGYNTAGSYNTTGGYNTSGTSRNADDLGDGSPALGGASDANANTTGASRTGNTANRSGTTGGSNAGSR